MGVGGECTDCRKKIGDGDEAYRCDVCDRAIHKACIGLTSSELKCMPLQKRILRMCCSNCQKFITKLPRLISMVEEMNNEMKMLKVMIGKLTVGKTEEELENEDEEKIMSYSAVVEKKKKKEEIVVIKPKDDRQRSSITRGNIQEKIDSCDLGEGVGVSGLKNIQKGVISMRCKSKEPIENV
uniref:Phorbol-ester/DAG-type domain-containing protein n=1 Tax=Anoplophora glabripennis TaxID=217634 RepID=V5I6N8_ANOGL